MSNLILHAGGFSATLADLKAAPAPDATRHYKPVLHAELREHILTALAPAGLKLEREQYGLTRDGRRMFGVLDVANGHGADDWRLAIGIRNSYDRSLAVGLCAGSRVFVCDNLAFSGEVTLSRKHTRGVWEDLPELTAGLLGEIVGPYAEDQRDQIDAMKQSELDAAAVDHLILNAFRSKVLPAGDIPDVIHQWDRPRHEEFAPRTAWSLFNAFTEVLKMSPAHLQFDRTLRLSRLFRAADARPIVNAHPDDFETVEFETVEFETVTS